MTSLRLKRGTTTQLNSYTGPPGELIVDTTSNQLRLHNGTTAGGVAVGALTVTSIKTSAYNANVNELVRINSTAGGFTITLPASPNDGSKIQFVDVGNQCGANPVLVSANGKTILGDSTGISLDLNGAGLSLIFNELTNDWSKINMFSSSFGIVTEPPPVINFTGFTTPASLANYQQRFDCSAISCNSSGKFVVVGYSGNYSSFSTSTDGVNWTTPSSIAENISTLMVSTLTINNSGKFVVIGTNVSNDVPYFSTSTNGTTWDNFSLFNNNTVKANFRSVTCNSSSRYVVVGYNYVPYFNPVFSYSDDGATWISPSTFNGYGGYCSMWSVCCNSAGRFVSIGSSNGDTTHKPMFSYSDNGITWSTPASIAGHTGRLFGLKSAVNSAGRFVTVAYDDSNLAYFSYSDNGVTWSSFASLANYQQNFWPSAIMVHPTGKFIVVGRNNTGPVYSTSTDGINWITPMLINQSYFNPQTIISNSQGKTVTCGYDNLNYPMFSTSL